MSSEQEFEMKPLDTERTFAEVGKALVDLERQKVAKEQYGSQFNELFLETSIKVKRLGDMLGVETFYK